MGSGAGPGRAEQAVSQQAAGGARLWCRSLPRGSVLACSGEGPVRAGISFCRPAGENREWQGVLGDAQGFSGDARVPGNTRVVVDL